jgi:trimethylamine--corrinoid protein Co-methyltransferase
MSRTAARTVPGHEGVHIAATPRATLRVWDDDACRLVHGATLRVLAETGVEMHHAGAREACAAAGAPVNGARVCLPAALVTSALASAPRSTLLRPRGGGTQPLQLAQGRTYFGTGPDCLYVSDPVTGERRRAVLADVAAAAALAELLPHIDFVMSMGLPEDADAQALDLAQFRAMLQNTRKPIVVSSPFPGASLRVMRRMAAACGEARSFACLAMSSPPLMLDEVACDKIMTCAELGVPLVLAGAPSAGTTAPASVTAVATVANAEMLAGLVLHQLTSPGAPYVYGAGCGAINMRTFVDVYNAPATFVGDQAMMDLAAWYGLPSWSYAGHSDSKMLDEQWALELGASTILGALSRATLLHDVGYLESGMQSALEGMVLGDELAGYACALLEELPVDDDSIVLDEIAAVGPGGDHLARRMTRERHRRFWQAGVIDQQTHERWRAEGARPLLARVRERLHELQAAPAPFTLDPDVAARLDDLVSA